MSYRYDFEDEQIREMVLDTHRPEEPDMYFLADGTRISTGDDRPCCRFDHQPWPCGTIRQFRERRHTIL